jgi:hypothetical protein
VPVPMQQVRGARSCSTGTPYASPGHAHAHAHAPQHQHQHAYYPTALSPRTARSLSQVRGGLVVPEV